VYRETLGGLPGLADGMPLPIMFAIQRRGVGLYDVARRRGSIKRIFRYFRSRRAISHGTVRLNSRAWLGIAFGHRLIIGGAPDGRTWHVMPISSSPKSGEGFASSAVSWSYRCGWLARQTSAIGCWSVEPGQRAWRGSHFAQRLARFCLSDRHTRKRLPRRFPSQPHCHKGLRGVIGARRIDLIELAGTMAYIGPRVTMAATQSKAGSKKTGGLTPAMRQYADQKAAAPDALLLFRMGDFYEMFWEDAETASRVLGLTLTTRNKGENPIPLAGIPYHALASYLTKLVKAGYKVAISEQVEDPKQAKGVVKREVVRIVTPGTLTDDALLDKSEDNYLACVCQRRDGLGLACVELSTGAFWVQPVDEASLVDELARLDPAELLLPEMPIDRPDPLAQRLSGLTDDAGGSGLAITRRPPHVFDPYQAEQILCKHFGVVTLEGFGFKRIDPSLCAAAVIIDYLAETQKTSLPHIVSLKCRNTSDFVWIDQATWRSLEVDRTIRSGSVAGSLVYAIDRTASAMGARCLRRWLAAPLRKGSAIIERQQAIADLLCDPHLLNDMHQALGELADIERITARLGVGRASPRDLLALGRTLLKVEEIADRLDTLSQRTDLASQELCPFLSARSKALRGQRDLAEFLTNAIHPEAPIVLIDGGMIAPGYDEELDRLRSIGSDGKQWLADFQAREIERTGIPSLRTGFNNVFGYYIEVTNTHHDRVPPHYVRKQTLKNAERYITDELKKYETEVLTARDKAIAREQELFEVIRQHAVEHIQPLQRVALSVAEIDVVAGLSHLADERRYVRPEVVGEGIALEIKDGRHPVLEQTLAEKFVPNDCRLGLPNDQGDPSAKSETLIILTGPNMSGKSTYIRQVALLTLLAQTGSYVPAESMRFSPADRIFARVGASDEITRGQSTFMVEMSEAANILNNATDHSIVIIDELGRGTSTFDGLSLAWAITEQLVTGIGCRALFATHYHELTQLADYLAGVANYNVAVREWEDNVIFLHRIIRGGTDRSYGVHVAKLAGVPRDVIARSQELLSELETNMASPGRSPKRASRRNKRDNQLMLFADPADDVIAELRKFDLNNTTPLDALKALERWRKQLD